MAFVRTNDSGSHGLVEGNLYRGLTAEKLVREENIGHRLVAQLQRKHVDRMIGKRVATPGAANNALTVLRILLRHAIELGWRTDDPTLRIRRFTGGEHHTWTDEEIADSKSTGRSAPVSARPLPSCSLRPAQLCDVRTMAWSHLEGSGINVAQQKTKARLWIPLHPELATILAQWPRSHVAILTSNLGAPFSRDRLQHWLAWAIERAGLPKRCVPHGLRKAAARRLAEAGCTAHQIAAITGHKTLGEIERYTRAAEQRGLAHAAMAQLQNKDSQT